MANSGSPIDAHEATTDAVYDSFAESYGYEIETTYPSWLKYDLARRFLRPDYDVLDVGCANGIHMRRLARECCTITGIDINEKFVELASERLRSDGISNAVVLRQSATRLELEEECMDLVYSFSTLQLVPDLDKALAEIGRVLRVGGVAIFDLAGCFNLSQIYWGIYYRRHGHFGVNSHSYGEICRKLAALNLRIRETYASGFADQGRYLPLVGGFTGPGSAFDRWLHEKPWPDRDFRISNSRLFFPFANRWYIVASKEGAL